MFGKVLTVTRVAYWIMTERREELRALADKLTQRPGIVDAYTAKSFTDRLFVIEVPEGETVPQEVADVLAEHSVYPTAEVYGEDSPPEAPFAGSEDHDQFRYVDAESRGELQSYVVD